MRLTEVSKQHPCRQGHVHRGTCTLAPGTGYTSGRQARQRTPKKASSPRTWRTEHNSNRTAKESAGLETGWQQPDGGKRNSGGGSAEDATIPAILIELLRQRGNNPQVPTNQDARARKQRMPQAAQKQLHKDDCRNCKNLMPGGLKMPQ